MLMNKLELVKRLDKDCPFWDFIVVEDIKDKFIRKDVPMKYEGIVEERIGLANIWNDVGCLECNIWMYKPVGGGTILYDYN